MKVWGVDKFKLEDIAREVPAEIRGRIEREGNAWRITLVPVKKHGMEIDGKVIWPYQRRGRGISNTERKVHALCFHGYTKFMKLVFDENPDARIKSVFGEVTRSNFKEKIWQIGTRNIGARVFPMQFREACFCVESDWLDDYVENVEREVIRYEEHEPKGEGN